MSDPMVRVDQPLSLTYCIADGDRPLAGKSLRPHVRIHEVRDPTPVERITDIGGGTRPRTDRH